MKLYIPIYDGQRKSLEFDPAEVRLFSDRKRMALRGRIYNCEHVYTTPEGVVMHWRKEYGAADKVRVCLV